MSHLLYLMFRCDFDVMKNLENLEKLKGSEHSLAHSTAATYCTATTCTRLQTENEKTKKRKEKGSLSKFLLKKHHIEYLNTYMEY